MKMTDVDVSAHDDQEMELAGVHAHGADGHVDHVPETLLSQQDGNVHWVVVVGSKLKQVEETRGCPLIPCHQPDQRSRSPSQRRGQELAQRK